MRLFLRRILLFAICRLEKQDIKKVRKKLALLKSYSVCGLRALEKHYVLAQDMVTRKVPGDFVECGVLNGGSAAAIAMALRETGRKAWLYDSFQGMPATSEVDGPEAAKHVGGCVGSETKVLEALRIAGFPEERCIIRKGWYEDAFQEPLPEIVSYLHIDCDWYESVLLALNTFYGRVAEGGIVVLDDFGHWEGCREAFYDFVNAHNLKPLLERFGYTQAYWVKGCLHNRGFEVKWELP